MKSKGLAAFLGFFVIGLFYATGFTKKGLGYVIGLWIVSALIACFIAPELSIIVNIAGAYLGYKFAEEANNTNSNGTSE